MKQFAELIPVVLFVITYKMQDTVVQLGSFEHKLDGIYSATAVLMIATTLQVALTAFFSRKVEKKDLWILTAVLVFGGLTLALKNQLFIQWKPTIFNWAMALVFVGSQFIGEKNIMERMLGSQIDLPSELWTRLNYIWAGNFTLVGTLNLVVAYNCSEAFWVDYKLYSAFGFTLVLLVITGFIISPHLKEEEN